MFIKQDDKCTTIENFTPWKVFEGLVSNEEYDEKRSQIKWERK